MSLPKWPTKDPDELLDYTYDWTALLVDGDEVFSVVWDTPGTLVEDHVSQTTTSTTIWLSGGTAGETYHVGCKMTTTAGRTYDRTVVLKMKEPI